MFLRQSFMWFLFLVAGVSFSNGSPGVFGGAQPKPKLPLGILRRSKPKPVQPAEKPNPQAGRSIVVNNNCGPASGDREMMAHIKAKVDYIAAQLRKLKGTAILEIFAKL